MFGWGDGDPSGNSELLFCGSALAEEKVSGMLSPDIVVAVYPSSYSCICVPEPEGCFFVNSSTSLPSPPW